ncbi:MAG: EAL domain-containing protein, partial [Planctomycetaceae bacterium]|nr:EAL domain-containing protein [Planctomycetaceae bacterium]
PNGNMIPPSEFVPLAEQTGLILALGERVFHKAAKYARAWANEGHAPLIAVNVSPNQLRHPDFVKQLKDILQKTRTEAKWFELEITEYAMMEDVAHSIRIINELADLGFSIAVDDFGTGYSSLSYLKHFQIHTLKIDLSFIHDVTTDWQSSAVVRSIVSLGSGLGLNVVAEGVETEEQAKLLTELGCTYLQGYYFAKPMAAEHYIHWASQNAPV